MRKLTNWEKVGYGFGDVGNSVTFTMTAMFLLMFYTDVLKIPPVAAGVLFFIARIWDAFADTVMGAFIDRRGQKSPAGKFRPFLIKGSWPVLVLAVLVFVAPEWDTSWKIVWAYATYIAWGTAYSFINIPYGSLASVMTDDQRDRAALSVTRSVGGALGGLLPQMVVVPIVLMFANPKTGWVVAMASMAVVAFVGYVISYKTSVEQIQHNPKEKKATLKEILMMIKTNRPFWGVSVGSIAIIVTWMLNGAMAIYYFKFNLHAEVLYGIKGFIGMIPVLVLSPILALLVSKYGNRKLAIWGSVFTSLSYLIIFVLPDNIYIYFAFFFLGSVALSFPNMLTWMMIADCVEYAEWKSGKRQEAIVYAAYSFMRKISQAFSGLLAGIGLSLIGYQAGATQQSAHTLFGIKFFAAGIPFIGMIVAMLAFLFIYNLTPKFYKQIILDLEKRRERQEQ
ncbi:MAG: glycoside-pentoside-hexuronide (GPH):cation symporter [Negativicutes bacterium]|jgi:GPH family glycoside/pentoside/hexuronide:cation symporter